MLMPSHVEPASPAPNPTSAKSIRIEYWPISRLKPYERNPRKNDKAVDRIRASIREFGFAVPVLANSDGEVIDGHLRLKGALAEKMQTVPVIPCDGWTDAQVKAFRLMVNRSVTWAAWDLELLAAEFTELQALDFDLTLTGFDAKGIDAFTLEPNPAEDNRLHTVVFPPLHRGFLAREQSLRATEAHDRRF
jgi:ParB-like chromosome segregation protein Spo0J